MTEQKRDLTATRRSGDPQNKTSNIIHMGANPKVIINQHLSKKLQEQNGQTYQKKSVFVEVIKNEIVKPSTSMKNELFKPSTSMKNELVKPLTSMKNELVKPLTSMKNDLLIQPTSTKNELVKPPMSMKNELVKLNTSMKNQQNEDEHPTKKKPPPLLLQNFVPISVRMSKAATPVISKPSESKVANNPLVMSNSAQSNNSPVKPKGYKSTDLKKLHAELVSRTKLLDENIRLATFTVNYKVIADMRIFTATYIYPDGSLEVRTAENFIELIGKKRFDILMSALSTVQDQELKNIAIQAFLTPKSDFINVGTQTETPIVSETKPKEKRQPVRNLQVPYVLEKKRKTIQIKKHIIDPFSCSEELNEISYNRPAITSQSGTDHLKAHVIKLKKQIIDSRSEQMNETSYNKPQITSENDTDDLNANVINLKNQIMDSFSRSEEINEITYNIAQNQSDADDLSDHVSSEIISHVSLPPSLGGFFTPSLLDEPEKEVHKLVDFFKESKKHEKQSTSDTESFRAQKRPSTSELEVENSKRRLIDNFESTRNEAIIYEKGTPDAINEIANQSSPPNANGENTSTSPLVQNPVLTTNIPFLNLNNACGKVMNTNSNIADTLIPSTIDLAVQTSILQKLSASEHALIEKLKPEDWFHLATPEKMKMLTEEEKKFILDIQMYIDCMMCLTSDEDNNLPIHNAVLNHDLELLKRQCYILKAKNQSIDIGDANYNYSALQMCIVHHAPREFAMFLLQQGASPLAPDDEDRSAVHLAAETAQPEPLELLLEEMSARPRVFLKAADLWSSEMEDYKDKELVDILLTHAINQMDNRGKNPLMVAAGLGHGEHVMHLLEQLIDPSDPVNKQSATSGETALYMAVVGACHQAQRHGDMTKVPVNYGTTINHLIRFGANPWIENRYGGNINLLITEYHFGALNLFINNALGKTKFRPITMEISTMNEDGSEVIESTLYQGIQPFIIRKNDNGSLDFWSRNNDFRKHKHIPVMSGNYDRTAEGEKIHKSKYETKFEKFEKAIVENITNVNLPDKTGEAMSYSHTLASVSRQKDSNETVDKTSGRRKYSKNKVDKNMKFITEYDIKNSHRKHKNILKKNKKNKLQERQTLDILISNMKLKSALEEQEFACLLSSNKALLETTIEKHMPTTSDNSITSIQNINNMTTLTSSQPMSSPDDNTTTDDCTTLQQQNCSDLTHLVVEDKGINSKKLKNSTKINLNDIKNFKIPMLKRKITVMSRKKNSKEKVRIECEYRDNNFSDVKNIGTKTLTEPTSNYAVNSLKKVTVSIPKVNSTKVNTANESAKDQPSPIQRLPNNRVSCNSNMDIKNLSKTTSNCAVTINKVSISVPKIKSTKANSATTIAKDQPSNIQTLLKKHEENFNNIYSKTQMDTASDPAGSSFKKCTVIPRIILSKVSTAKASCKDQPSSIQTDLDKNVSGLNSLDSKTQMETGSNHAVSSFKKCIVIPRITLIKENIASASIRDQPSNKQTSPNKNICNIKQTETVSNETVSSFKNITDISGTTFENAVDSIAKIQPSNLRTSPNQNVSDGKNIAHKKQSKIRPKRTLRSFRKCTSIPGINSSKDKDTIATAICQPSNKQRKTASNANSNFNDAFVSSLSNYSETAFRGFNTDLH